MHEIAGVDETAHDLSADAEREIGLVARPHRADELAAQAGALEFHALHLDRTLDFADRSGGRGCGRRVAAGEEQREQSQGEQRAGNLHGAGNLQQGGDHGKLLFTSVSIICDD